MKNSRHNKTNVLFITNLSLRTQAVQLANHLTYAANQAYFNRDYKVLMEVGRAISNLSSKHETTGQYFQGLALCKQGRGEVRSAYTLFENAISGDGELACNALIARGNGFVIGGDVGMGTKLIHASLKISKDKGYLFPYLQSQIALFTILYEDKNYRGANEALTRIEPLVRQVGNIFPNYYLDFLNNLACVTNSLGQTSLAHDIISKAVKSPTSHRYPEWMETALAIKVSEKNAVALDSPLPTNITYKGKKNPDTYVDLSEYVKTHPRVDKHTPLLFHTQSKVTLFLVTPLDECSLFSFAIDPDKNNHDFYARLFYNLDELAAETYTPFKIKCVWSVYGKEFPLYNECMNESSIPAIIRMTDSIKANSSLDGIRMKV